MVSSTLTNDGVIAGLVGVGANNSFLTNNGTITGGSGYYGYPVSMSQTAS